MDMHHLYVPREEMPKVSLMGDIINQSFVVFDKPLRMCDRTPALLFPSLHLVVNYDSEVNAFVDYRSFDVSLSVYLGTKRTTPALHCVRKSQVIL